MFWENFQPYNVYGGLYLKIYIFLKWFSIFFFKYDLFYFFKKWSWNKKNQINFTSSFLVEKQFNFDYKIKSSLQTLYMYIYSLSNKNYILFIYGSLKPVIKLKKKKPEKKIRKHFLIV